MVTSLFPICFAVSRERGYLFHRRQPAGGRAADATTEPVESERRRIRTTPVDDYSSPEPIFDVGGPILKERVWFFVGYNPSWTDRTRTERFGATGPTGTFSQTAEARIVNYNVTGQITKNLRGGFAASNQRDKGGYALPSSGPNGVSTSNAALFPSVIRRDSSNDSYSGVLDWVVNNRTHVNVTTTRFKVDQHDVGTFSTALRHTFQASNFQFPQIPASLQKINGFADNPSSSQFVRGGLSRFNFNADVTRYANWRG